MAQPRTTYTFTPITAYYIIMEGDLNDVMQGLTVAIPPTTPPSLINFSTGPGAGKFVANVTVDSSKNFTISYA